jgi:outer membrane protein OmpA-like peptidoglycan-associated protein
VAEIDPIGAAKRAAEEARRLAGESGPSEDPAAGAEDLPDKVDVAHVAQRIEEVATSSKQADAELAARAADNPRIDADALNGETDSGTDAVASGDSPQRARDNVVDLASRAQSKVASAASAASATAPVAPSGSSGTASAIPLPAVSVPADAGEDAVGDAGEDAVGDAGEDAVGDAGEDAVGEIHDAQPATAGVDGEAPPTPVVEPVAEDAATTTAHEWVHRPSTYARVFPVGLALAGLVGISAWHNTRTKDHVETKLRTEALAKLKKEFPNLDVSFDGRDATLKGSVADPTARARAHDLVRGVTGVRHVNDPKIAAAPATGSPADSDPGTSTPDTFASEDIQIAAPLPVSDTSTAKTAGTKPAATASTAAPTSAVPPTTSAVPPTTSATTAVAAPTTTTPLAEEIPVPETPTETARQAPADYRGRLLFDFTSSSINATSASAVDDLAAYLKANPDVQIGLSGHTDRTGSTITNLAISKARADSVRTALVAKGIDPSRIKAFGYGARLPIDTNATSDGRRQNRRVDVKFFGGTGQEVSFTG